ncbi:hypothetical protein AB1Y20_001880 [Prymnesium parvum]|uniref:Response regulatory domain-containing protein n=1 Tax=Prymnesium parvum TaxID=97485 RepID=A0AB34J7U9_PRYPA
MKVRSEQELPRATIPRKHSPAQLAQLKTPTAEDAARKAMMESSKEDDHLMQGKYQMHPFLLSFEDKNVEATFLQSYDMFNRMIYVGSVLLLFGTLLLRSEAEMMNEHMSWRLFHTCQVVVFLAASLTPWWFRFIVILFNISNFIASNGPYHLKQLGCSYLGSVVFPWFVATSQRRFRSALPLLIVNKTLTFIFFTRHGYLLEWVVVATWSELTCWLHERVARCTFVQTRLVLASKQVWLTKQAKAEITHLQGNFLFQIGCLTNDPTIHALLRRSKMWVGARQAVTMLKIGTYVSQPSLVHMPTVFLDMSFDIISSVQHVEIDALLFNMCCEQARSNAAKFGMERVRVSQRWRGGLLQTNFVSTNAPSTPKVPPDHDYFTCAKTRDAGVGLASVKLACDSLGGKCSLEAVEPNQTRLSVSLPARPASPPPPPATTARPSSCVLVDDEDVILSILSSTMHAQAPTVRVVEVGACASQRELCDRILAASPQLVICDNHIDHISGIDSAKELCERGYDGIFLLQTACSVQDQQAMTNAHADVLDGVLIKDLSVANQALAIYSEIVLSAQLPDALCASLEAGSARVGELIAAGDVDGASREAYKIMGKCALYAAASRVNQMAAKLHADPSPLHARAFDRMCRQLRLFSRASETQTKSQ